MYKSKEWMDWWTDVRIEKNFAALVPSVINMFHVTCIEVTMGGSIRLYKCLTTRFGILFLTLVDITCPRFMTVDDTNIKFSS